MVHFLLSVALLPARAEPVSAPIPPAAALEPSPAPSTSPEAAAIEELDRLWEERHIQGTSKRALEVARKYAGAMPTSFEVQWRFVRAAYWLAEWTTDNRVKEAVGKEGYAAGMKMMALQPRRVEGPYWTSTALSQYGLAIGILSALTKGLGGKYESLCDEAIALDPTYDRGGPHVSLGRYYYELPWPKRSLSKSREHLEKARAIAPHHARTLAYLADTLLADDEEDAALAGYQQCAALDPTLDDYADAIIWREYCRKKTQALTEK